MINIRPMQIEDYLQVIEIWGKTENIGLSQADTIEQIDSFLNRNPGLSFIACEGDQIIGAVLGGHDGRRGAIYHLAVIPIHRAKGIGQALVDHCIAGFSSIGIERCHIHVYADNPAGLRFWQKNGWFTRPELVLLSKDTSNPVTVKR